MEWVFTFLCFFQGRGDTGVGGENKKRDLEEWKRETVGVGECVCVCVEISVSNQKFPANWMSDFINDEIYKGP